MSEPNIEALKTELRQIEARVKACFALLEPVQFKSSLPPGAAAVKEETFSLNFETQRGPKLGEYEIAYRANNIEDKWAQAHNILRQSNSTIKARYHGPGYLYAYWLYGEDKIYRQKLGQI